jgi:hypothetical protein
VISQVTKGAESEDDATTETQRHGEEIEFSEIIDEAGGGKAKTMQQRRHGDTENILTFAL